MSSSTPKLEEQQRPSQPVVIFDGVCGLCNHSVDFIIRFDKKERFVFAPNQSEVAQSLLAANGIETTDVDTIYLYDNETLYEKSTAAFRIASALPWPWKMATVGRLVPRIVRDGIYGFIAKNRYQWFGKHETCRIPTPAERSRFL